MNYNSTRNKEIRCESAYAIKTGISSDGGLFVPESIPCISSDFIIELAKLSYKDRASKILGLFLTDFSKQINQEMKTKTAQDSDFIL